MNAKTLVVIGARLNSSRLPKKHLLPLAGKPLIVRLFERLKHITMPCEIVVATTSDSYNDLLETECLHAGINCVRYDGDVNNLVMRIDFVVQNSNAEIISYVCGDCPLVEPKLIDKLVAGLVRNPHKKFTSLARQDKVIHEGIAAYSRAGWDTLVQNCQDAQDREHVGLSLKRIANIQEATLYIEEDDVYFEVDHRISVDTSADYQFMSQVYDKWYAANAADSIVSLAWVIDLIKRDPLIAAVNQKVFQKAAREHYQTLTLVCEAGTQKGLGQFKRVLRLANHMQEHYGYGTELLILADTLCAPELTFFNHQIFSSEKQLLETLFGYKNRVIVFDIFPSRLTLPDLWRQQLSHLKTANNLVIGLDRCAQWHKQFDHVWIPSFYFEAGTDDTKSISYGWDYYLIDQIQSNTQKNKLLILTGGGDNLSYGEWLPNWLDDHLPNEIMPTWLQGPYATAPKLRENPRLCWNLATNSNKLSEYLAQAEYVVTVHGVSLFEAIACNKKCVVLPSEPLITPSEYRAFKATNTALCIEDFETDITMISDLTNQHYLHGISTSDVQHRLVKGTQNVCREIHAFINQQQLIK